MPQGVYVADASANGYQTQNFALWVVNAGETLNVDPLTLTIEKGRAQGRVFLSDLSSHTGVNVRLLGTDLSTTSAFDGTWELLAPLGNYNGVSFEKELHESLTVAETVTLTASGVANIADQTLTQVANDLVGSASMADASSPTAIRVQVDGVSGSATNGFSAASWADANGD